MNTEITNTETLTPEMQTILAQLEADKAIQTEDENGTADVEVVATETVTVQ